MEFIVPTQLLLVIASAVVLLSALVIRIVRDAGAVNQVAQLNRLLIKAGRARLKTGVSVILELNRKADTIIPLLDHIAEQSYKKLEVIIVIKQTAGKNARPTLTRYKRAHPEVQLRLINFKAGMTLPEIVRRYAQKPLVMTLSADQRLSPDFFSHISVDYALEHPDRIIPRRMGMLDNRLRTALAAYATSMTKTASTSQEMLPGIVYKRASLLRASKSEPTAVNSSTYIMAPTLSVKSALSRSLSTSRLSWPLTLLVLIALSGLIYTGISLKLSDQLFLLALIIGVAVFMYITDLVGIKAYSPLEKMSLILLSPFFMLYRGISYLWEVILTFARALKQAYNFSKQLLPRKKYS
jgi:hypothetical protein